jgi:hypothetical protein
MTITHATAAPGVDSGDGKISHNAWDEDHVFTTTGQFVAIFDGGGAAPTVGSIVDILAPFDGTITDWVLFGNVAGSAEVKIAKDITANFPPTFEADAITASARPALSGAATASSSTLTGWTTTVVAGDVLRFYLTSASTLSRLTCVLNYSRP